MSDLLNEFSKNRLLAELLISNNNVYSVELNRSLSEVFRELVNEHLSVEDAKYYQCQTCYRWLDNWGKLVIIDTSRPLMIRSVLWSTEIADEKSVWQLIFAKMGEYVESAVIDVWGNYTKIPVSPQFTPTTTKGTFAHMWIDPWKVKVPKLEGWLVAALEKRIMSTGAATLLTVKSAFNGGQIAKLRNTDAILSGIEMAMKLPFDSKDKRVLTNATVAILDKHPAMRDYPYSVHNKLFDQALHNLDDAFSEWKFITSASKYH